MHYRAATFATAALIALAAMLLSGAPANAAPEPEDTEELINLAHLHHDDALIERIREGDEAAIAELLRDLG